jgi:hypothetical protein
VKAFVKKQLESLFARRGYSLIPAHVLRAYDTGSDPVPSPPVSAEAQQYLRNDNPRLQELRRRYAALNVDAVAHSLWDPKYVSAEVRLDSFRAHSAYVWGYLELSRPTQMKYYLYSQYAKAKAPHLLARLHEDGAFGAMCYDFEIAGRVSRDRLDSAIELDFLDRHLQILERPQLRPPGSSHMRSRGAGRRLCVCRRDPGIDVLGGVLHRLSRPARSGASGAARRSRRKRRAGARSIRSRDQRP